MSEASVVSLQSSLTALSRWPRRNRPSNGWPRTISEPDDIVRDLSASEIGCPRSMLVAKGGQLEERLAQLVCSHHNKGNNEGQHHLFRVCVYVSC